MPNPRQDSPMEPIEEARAVLKRLAAELSPQVPLELVDVMLHELTSHAARQDDKAVLDGLRRAIERLTPKQQPFGGAR